MTLIKTAVAATLAAVALPVSAAQISLSPGSVYAYSAQFSASFSADNIFDQQTGTVNEGFFDGSYWLNPDGAGIGTISVDLGAQYRIGSFDLFNTSNGYLGDRGTGAFSIIASNDAAFASFTTIVSGSLVADGGGTKTAQTFASTSNSLFQFIQFRATGTAAPNNNPPSPSAYGLNELRVFDAPFIPAPTGVPEPASWAMLIGGFGLAGAAMRRRRRVVFA